MQIISKKYNALCNYFLIAISVLLPAKQRTLWIAWIEIAYTFRRGKALKVMEVIIKSLYCVVRDFISIPYPDNSGAINFKPISSRHV